MAASPSFTDIAHDRPFLPQLVPSAICLAWLGLAAHPATAVAGLADCGAGGIGAPLVA
jgi:hypothetical protein